MGARIVDITLDDSSVALNYSQTSEYHHDPYYLGATIGPIANRLADGRITIEQQQYYLKKNEGENALHGGVDSYDKCLWKVIKHNETSIEFGLSIGPNTNALPGTIDLSARYQVNGQQLLVNYVAHTSQTNYLNLSNHVYLNLGPKDQSIQQHEFTLFANHFLLTDHQGIPKGKSVKIKTPLHYSPALGCDVSQLEGKVDHHFNLSSNPSDSKLNKLVEAKCRESSTSVVIYSDKPGFQFYTGHHLDMPFQPFSGFCVEPQYPPNAPNDENSESPYCSPEHPYRHSIVYQFDWPKTQTN